MACCDSRFRPGLAPHWVITLGGDRGREPVYVRSTGMSFSPWHGLAAHRPLGGIMRARKEVYEMAKRFRAEKNGRIIEEPRERVMFDN